jgi:hypothetical protein
VSAEWTFTSSYVDSVVDLPVKRPRELTVEVSYDEGTSWQRVRVSRDLV